VLFHFITAYAFCKDTKQALRFFAAGFDKSFESCPGSGTGDRHGESRLYVGSFDGAPARPVVGELPAAGETRPPPRALFGKFAERFNTKRRHSGQGCDKGENTGAGVRGEPEERARASVRL
jgi:hypothetical protein